MKTFNNPQGKKHPGRSKQRMGKRGKGRNRGWTILHRLIWLEREVSSRDVLEEYLSGPKATKGF